MNSTTTKMTPEKLFTESVMMVNSVSIKQWAQTEKNRPVFIQLAQEWIRNGKSDPVMFSTYMVALAMGL